MSYIIGDMVMISLYVMYYHHQLQENDDYDDYDDFFIPPRHLTVKLVMENILSSRPKRLSSMPCDDCEDVKIILNALG